MIDDDDDDVPLPLTLSGVERKSVNEIQSLLDSLAKDLSDGRAFDSTEDELATHNWYLQVRTEILRRKTRTV